MHSLLVKLDRSVFTLLLIASIWGFDKVSEKGSNRFICQRFLLAEIGLYHEYMIETEILFL